MEEPAPSLSWPTCLGVCIARSGTCGPSYTRHENRVVRGSEGASVECLSISSITVARRVARRTAAPLKRTALAQQQAVRTSLGSFSNCSFKRHASQSSTLLDRKRSGDPDRRALRHPTPTSTTSTSNPPAAFSSTLRPTMNRESLRQALRVHVQRLRQQHMRSQSDGSVPSTANSSSSFAVSCTVDELVHQVEGALSTEKPDYGFGEALARLQMIMGVGGSSSNNGSSTGHRRGSLGGSGRRGSLSDMLDMIDAEAMVSRHSLKSIA